MAKIRKPYVAGLFYEGKAELLQEQVEECFLSPLGPGKVPEEVKSDLKRSIGLISPHAGYIYSGAVAAHDFYLLSCRGRPKNIVILGTNHTGLGAAVSLQSSGIWETPLGRIEIDTELAQAIKEKSDLISESEAAFQEEHSIEVQLPFLQYVLDDFKFVPLVLRDQSMEVAIEVGEAVAQAVNKGAAIIASSDFTHYEPQDTAYKKDRQAIKRIEELALEGFYRAIEQYSISICGYGAIAALMRAAQLLHLGQVRLLKYATSGDAGGGKEAVVGYASIVFEGS